ncbi:MAG: hypothetical protein QME44_02445, partial [Thermodesulfobacteriota bacterium]|nr:hypothetical protein [Thermodesulfobacteriota bacterium]
LTDEKEKYRQMKKLNFLVLKLNAMQKRPVNLEENEVYYEKLTRSLGTLFLTTRSLGTLFLTMLFSYPLASSADLSPA